MGFAKVAHTMFGFTALAGSDPADPLVNMAAVDDFWRLLPRFDPIRAQRKVSDVLADFGVGEDPNVERLRALLLMDRRSRNLADVLLVSCTGRQPQPLERRYWHSARELAQVFGRAYGQILRQLERDMLPRAARDFTPLFLLRMLQHRQIEVLLQPFTNGQVDTGTWSELHEAYQYAHSQRLLTVCQEIRRPHEMATVETTIEQEYLHLLLLDLINAGHFSPYDAFWVNQWIPINCEGLTLKSMRRPSDRTTDHFVVDLDSSEGLVRASPSGALRCLFLDPTPLLARIDSGIAARRDGIHSEGGPPTTLGQGSRLKVLRKLRSVFSPKPPRVTRRGERKPVAVVVEAIVGLTNILRMLRSEQHRASLLDPSETPELEEITITATGATVEATTLTGLDGVRTIVPGTVAGTPPRLMWEIRDRSESGCRLHGKAVTMSGVTPGNLIAMREHEMAPWILVVVRRRGKVASEHVDLGVEFIGKEPKRVIATLIDDTTSPGAEGQPERRVAILFLPESGRQPVLPFKTVVVPAGQFGEQCLLTLRAGGARHTLRLKQPIEEQGEFSWMPFEVVERQTLATAA
jgi:hypothetical protein